MVRGAIRTFRREQSPRPLPPMPAAKRRIERDRVGFAIRLPCQAANAVAWTIDHGAAAGFRLLNSGTPITWRVMTTAASLRRSVALDTAIAAPVVP